MSGSRTYQLYYQTDNQLFDFVFKTDENSEINLIAIPGINKYEAEKDAKRRILFSAGGDELVNSRRLTCVSCKENTSWNPA